MGTECLGLQPRSTVFGESRLCGIADDFRGSTGYGRKFWEASFRQRGRAMQDDVTDGVQWLMKEGIADP